MPTENFLTLYESFVIRFNFRIETFQTNDKMPTIVYLELDE